MKDIPLGLSLDEEAGGLVLRRRDGDGTITSLVMSTAEIEELSETISSWEDRRSSEIVDRSGRVQEVVYHQVVNVGLSHEILRERLLLTLIGASGHLHTYGLPLHLIDVLVEHMPLYAAEIRAAKPQRQ